MLAPERGAHRGRVVAAEHAADAGGLEGQERGPAAVRLLEGGERGRDEEAVAGRADLEGDAVSREALEGGGALEGVDAVADAAGREGQGALDRGVAVELAGVDREVGQVAAEAVEDGDQAGGSGSVSGGATMPRTSSPTSAPACSDTMSASAR